MADEKGSLAEHMIEQHGVSQRRAYKAVSLPRSSERYKCKPKADEAVMDALNTMVQNTLLLAFGKALNV